MAHHIEPLDLPELDAGLAVLERPSNRSTALHRLVVDELRGRDDDVLWVDARNNASSYLLYELAASERSLDGVRLARAFTAYQHHSLVRDLVARVDDDTGLVVLPCVASLYCDADVPGPVAAALLESALSILRELAATFEVPVLCTVTGEEALAETVREYAETTIECRETPMGLRYETEGFETLVYWHEGYWQTTIPYWVELVGAVRETDPATVAVDFGLAEVR